jgi:hypothetical protein
MALLCVYSPVNGGAVDQRGELAQPFPECVADRRHGDDKVQVLAALLNKEAVQSLRST